MAAQGGVVFQEKVSRMLRGHNGKPALKPNRPLALKDNVSNRNPKNREATCVTELSLLMVCWKQNNFVDSLCSSETKTFYACVAKAQADMKKNLGQHNIQGKRLPPKEATNLLKRYPNQRSEI